MNLTYTEFWNKYDKEMNAYKSDKTLSIPKINDSAQYLIRLPESGIGKYGKCYVVICQHCGFTKYTKSPYQVFCSHKCQLLHAHSPKSKITHPSVQLVSRLCSCCATHTIHIEPSKIKQGLGIYCSKICKSRSQGLKPLTYICNNCNTHFKGVSDNSSLYCSIECSIKATSKQHKALPKLLNSSDTIDHIINVMLHSIRYSNKLSSVTPTMRKQATLDLSALNIDPYNILNTSLYNQIRPILNNLEPSEIKDYLSYLISESEAEDEEKRQRIIERQSYREIHK